MTMMTREDLDAGRVALAIPEKDATTVQFTLGTTVVGCLSLDDAVLVKSMAPSLTKVKGYLFAATRGDAAVILNDLIERAEPGEFGFGHTKSERHALLQSARRLLAVLQDSVSTTPVAVRKVKVVRGKKVAGRKAA